MNSIRLLLVDDDVQLRSMIAELLRSEGYEADEASDGEQGLQAAQNKDYDLIVLDIMMPGKDGLEVLRELRTDSEVPVLMLTARGDDMDRIAGFEGGADDYLAKPFNPRELLLRVRAILKRNAAAAGSDVTLKVGPLVFEALKHRAYVGERQLQLTGAELRVLEALMRSPGKIVTRERLTEFALGRAHTPYDRSLDTHISHLRSKIGKDNEGRTPIQSIRGAGYLLVADDWEPAER